MRPGSLISAVVWAASAACTVLPANAQTPHTHQHRFDDAHKWSQVFDDPARDAWQKPHEVIQALAPKPDAVIADVGAGTGYFAMRFAHMVPKGRVYAVDTEPAMVKHLAERAKRSGLKNLVALQAASESPNLPQKAGFNRRRRSHLHCSPDRHTRCPVDWCRTQTRSGCR